MGSSVRHGRIERKQMPGRKAQQFDPRNLHTATSVVWRAYIARLYDAARDFAMQDSPTTTHTRSAAI
jgi:hypothetical protein